MNNSPQSAPDVLMQMHGMLIGMTEVIGLLLATHHDKQALQTALPGLEERMEVIRLNSPMPEPVLNAARETARLLTARLG